MTLSTTLPKTTARTNRFAQVKSVGRAAILSAFIGLGLFTAVPAQARDHNNNGTIQFGFSFNTGNGSFSFGNGGFNGRQFGDERRHRRDSCLSDRQVLRALSHQGFRHIRMDYGRGPFVFVEARRNGRSYEMDVNRCTAEITNMHRVRRWN